jgi:hypothetical protein
VAADSVAQQCTLPSSGSAEVMTVLEQPVFSLEGQLIHDTSNDNYSNRVITGIIINDNNSK